MNHMRTSQLVYHRVNGWTPDGDSTSPLGDAQLVLAFGDRKTLESSPGLVADLRARFPYARVVTCSTGGEILGNRVLEGTVTATALHFTSTQVVAIEQRIGGADQSVTVGEALGRALPPRGLRHVMVFCEGLRVNGTGIATGLAAGLAPGVTVTGGLAGDGERFQRTLVGLDERPSEGRVVAIGFYGAQLMVGMGSLGGWQTFGEDLSITRAEGNVLIELDGEPALTVYKRLIGPHAYGLPATGLLYPLLVRDGATDSGVVRTLLSVDPGAGTLTFAGDLPVGRSLRLMRANLDQLIDAAGTAASSSVGGFPAPEFALLVSCIGRKLVLQQRTAEEVWSARAAFGKETAIAGFYSYGELSPANPSAKCELHNQTMTITTLSER